MLHTLTSLRFVAATMVFAQHAGTGGLLGGTSGATSPLANAGHAAVTFFFVLSGFVLAWCYHASLASPTVAQLRSYFVARVARIVPMYVFAMVVAALLSMDVAAYQPATYALGLLVSLGMMQTWWPVGGSLGLPRMFDGPAWTLSVEATFYVAFPLLVWWLLRSGAVPRTRRLVLVAGLPLVAWYASGFAVGSGDYLANWYFGGIPLMQLPVFLAGLCLGLEFVRRRDAGATGGGRARALGWTLLEVAAIAAMTASLVVAGTSRGVWDLGPAFVPASLLCVWVFARERGVVSRVLRWAPFVVLGHASYAFYLLHTSIPAAIPFADGIDNLALRGLAMYVVLQVLCVGLYYAFERPMRTRLRARLSGAPPVSATVAAGVEVRPGERVAAFDGMRVAAVAVGAAGIVMAGPFVAGGEHAAVVLGGPLPAIAASMLLVLSGYLLQWRHGHRFEGPHASFEQGRALLARRVWRLWPLAAAAAVTAASARGPHFGADAWWWPVATLAQVHTWFPNRGANGLPYADAAALWTIPAVLAWAVAFPLAARVTSLLAARPRAAWATCALLLSWPLAMAWTFASDPYAPWMFHVYPPMAIGQLALGGMLAAMHARARRRPVEWRSTMQQLAALALAVGAIAGATAHPPLATALTAVPAALLVWSVRDSSGVIGVLLACRVFAAPARLCFSLVAACFPVLLAAAALGWNGTFTPAATVALGLTCVIVALATRRLQLDRPLPAQRDVADATAPSAAPDRAAADRAAA